MKLKKLTKSGMIVLLFVCLFYFYAPVSAQKKPAKETETSPLTIGKIDKGVYSNSKFSITLPEWSYFDDTLNLVAVAETFQSVKEKKPEKESDSAQHLIAVMGYPKSDSILAIKYHSGDVSTIDALKNFSVKAKEKDLKRSMSKAQILKDVTETSFGENKAFIFETLEELSTKKFWHTSYIVKIDDSNYLEIDWVVDKEEDKKIIEKSMTTLKINK